MSNILMVGNEPVGQVGYFTEQESIAPVVESPTTSAISSGSHFMYNGVRMVATSAIASGATLVVYPTVGYNCKAESVEEGKADKEWTLAGSRTIATGLGDWNLTKDISNAKEIMLEAIFASYPRASVVLPSPLEDNKFGIDGYVQGEFYMLGTYVNGTKLYVTYASETVATTIKLYYR